MTKAMTFQQYAKTVLRVAASGRALEKKQPAFLRM